MKRRAALVAAVLVACGGGGGSARSIDILGDSVASGLLQVPPAPYLRLPDPVGAQLERLSGRKVFDYSIPGADFAAAIDGTLPFGPLAEHLRRTPSDTVVFWYGGANAVVGTLPGRVEYDAVTAGTLAIERGKRVLMVGTYEHPDPGIGPRSDLIDAAIQRAAKSVGVPFVSIRGVPGKFIDPMHRDQESADGFVRRVLQSL